MCISQQHEPCSPVGPESMSGMLMAPWHKRGRQEMRERERERSSSWVYDDELQTLGTRAATPGATTRACVHMLLRPSPSLSSVLRTGAWPAAYSAGVLTSKSARISAISRATQAHGSIANKKRPRHRDIAVARTVVYSQCEPSPTACMRIVSTYRASPSASRRWPLPA